ncbi:class I SAM-dependent methyltransferase [Nocardia wallacei]|uniref:class I SAM-dependent methyltransferase n=1 Tax=Nocardia wallacei TaxID=480035 RepID=UPI002458BE98|nr:class I SAM-dependent methyltransferase [Nocardia wallacei]
MSASHENAGTSARQAAVHEAAAPYSVAFLTIYDIWVIRLSNRYGWRCDANTMLEPYRHNIGHRHLEVGPGSGWYLAHADFSDGPAQITLMDLNPTPLAFTARRLRKAGHAVDEVVGSVLDPVPAAAGTGYDSIGINFVMHCIPGNFTEKGVAFQHLSRVLTAEGVLFGSTILGRGRTPRTLFGRFLTTAYSRAGAFNNSDDDRDDLETALTTVFEEHTLTDVGDVTLFTGRRPRQLT